MIVEAVRAGRTPSQLLTPPAFSNAIRVLHALAGSTNAIVHLLALAGRCGVDLPLAEFDRLSRETPTLVNLKPTGSFLMEDFHRAGGTPALCHELADLLALDLPTISGETLGQALAVKGATNHEVIAPRDKPLRSDGGLAVLTVSLAPRGAVIKQSVASPELVMHRGRAVVFENYADMYARLDSPELDVTPQDILVLKNAGPLGGPGMPEWGVIPIPAKLARTGVRDMVRISDARISGTAAGTVVVHVAPEAAAGGPLASVQNGDWIELDIPARRLDLLVEPAEISRRLAKQPSTPPLAERGYRRLYAQHVLQADEGCDFDFLTRSGRSRNESARK